MATRRNPLKRDERGDFRPYIGYRTDGKQPRFNLGNDEPEAQRRRERIYRLYDECCKVRKNYGEEPCWTEAGLYAAKLIAEGQQQICVPHPRIINEAAGEGKEIGQYDSNWNPHDPFPLIWAHAVASRHYPSINWILPKEGASEAIEFEQSMFDMQAKRFAKLLGAQTPENPVAGTFHEALHAYDMYIETVVSQHVEPTTKHKRRDQVKYLRRTHEDKPLAFVNLDFCTRLFDHWRGRPKKVPSDVNGERYSIKTCTARISELSMFFDWLHTCPDFSWRKPRDYETINRTIPRNRVKRSIKDLVGKNIFDKEQLAELNRHCSSLERVLFYLGLNCSFGAAESGRLEAESDLFLHQKNPLEHLWIKYNFSTSEKDSWIAWLRPKTNVAGCWWLFPETVAAIEEWIEDRPETDEKRLIVSSTGKSLYRDNSKNAQSGFQNLWTNLLKRVQQKDSKFPSLPFGTLRDQFSDWAVHIGDSEAGSMALAHGTPFKDDLLSSYANLPFPRFFELQKRYREEWLAPVFAASKE